MIMENIIIPEHLRTKCEVFSRVVGYYRPVQNWNNGKTEEFHDRKEFDENISLNSEFALSGKPNTPSVRR